MTTVPPLRTPATFCLVFVVVAAISERSAAVADDENSVMWGLPDAVAPVGKLFEYRLRRDSDGNVGPPTGGDTGVDDDDGSGDIVGASEKTIDDIYQVRFSALNCLFVRGVTYTMSRCVG